MSVKWEPELALETPQQGTSGARQLPTQEGAVGSKTGKTRGLGTAPGQLGKDGATQATGAEFHLYVVSTLEQVSCPTGWTGRPSPLDKGSVNVNVNTNDMWILRRNSPWLWGCHFTCTQD